MYKKIEFNYICLIFVVYLPALPIRFTKASKKPEEPAPTAKIAPPPGFQGRSKT